MPSGLNDTELSIVRNMMLSSSDKDISDLLERPVNVITDSIKELVSGTGIITHQQKLDAKKSLRSAKLPKSPKPKILTDKARADQADQKHKETLRDIRNKIAVEREHNNRRRESQFKTIEVDYAKLVMVKIDDRTNIYAKPGEEEKTRAEYLKKHSTRKI